MRQNKILLAAIVAALAAPLGAQRTEAVRYGDFEHFTVRHITESKLLGGKQKTLYVIGPTDTLDGNDPYQYGLHTPWSSSNAYANVAGIAKGSNTMFPERRGNGHCARMDVMLERVQVFGVIDISVVVSGSIFLGRTLEPIRSTNDPYGYIDMGIPFTGRPRALMFDYKTRISDKGVVTESNGFKLKEHAGKDAAMVFVFLQKRWEDADGNVYAKRIGTGYQRFGKTVSTWQNAYQLPIRYGDVTSEPWFKPYMGLMPEDGNPYCCRNSKGEMVEIQEVGWGGPADEPTHIIVMFSSSIQPAFWGTIGNALWVDNVKFVY